MPLGGGDVIRQKFAQIRVLGLFGEAGNDLPKRMFRTAMRGLGNILLRTLFKGNLHLTQRSG